MDPTCSYFVQRESLQPDPHLKNRLLGVHGIINFYHKSFYDFLVDPERSSQFCVTTLAMREKLFDRYVQIHHHYVQRYAIQNSDLASAIGCCSSDLLFWPQKTEFIDSFLKRRAFAKVSYRLSPNSPMLVQLLGDASIAYLQKLADLDYRKYLVSEIVWHFGLREGYFVLGLAGVERVIQGTVFGRIHSKRFTNFDPQVFLNMLKKLEKSGAVKPYHQNFSAGLTSIYRSFSRPGRSSGQYKLGHGEKSIFWYWEFDTEKRYFHQFRTLDLEEAMRVYRTEKFRMWKDSWKPAP